MTKRLKVFLLITCLIVAVLAFAPSASAAGLNTGAGPWQWLLPENQGSTINDVSFIDANTGWAVGQGGVILKTTDGGATWNAQNSGTVYNITGVDFVSSTHGWAVGNLGEFTSFVLSTRDGGATWSQQPLPAGSSNAVLEDIDFANSANGIAVGSGKVYLTANGGATWVRGGAAQIDPNDYLKRVQMVSATTAYAVGRGGAVYKTTNSGYVWTDVSTGVTDELNGLYFRNTNEGIVVGSTGSAGRVLRTFDGGSSWVDDTASNPMATPLMDVVASSDNQTVVAAGIDGKLFYYSNANAWTLNANDLSTSLAAGQRAAGTDGIVNSVVFASASTAFAVGEAGLITKSTNSGNSWNPQAGGDVFNLVAASFVSSNTGWVAGDGGRVIKTVDGGESWVDDNTGLPADFQIIDVDFFNVNNGIAVGCRGAGCPFSGTGTAYKYTAGTWSPMTVPGGVVAINDVAMTAQNNAWAVGADGVALQTTNGASWAQNGVAAKYEFNGVDTIPGLTNWAWAVGNNTETGKAIFGRFNGTSWSVWESWPGISFFVDIDMLTSNNGYMVGSGGSVYKTTDGGLNWTPQTSGTSKLLAGVSFLDADYGFAVGEDGRLIHTTDGGASWGAENMGNNVSFFDIDTVDERKAYAVGGNGTVMKSLRSYMYTWYDNFYSDNWVLMANPASGSGNLFFDLFIAGNKRSLSPDNELAPGESLFPTYPGLIGGPVNTSSLTSEKAIVSQRILWPKGGDSLEEVLGMDIDRLSSHYYWPWYDQAGAGFTNWVMISNPNPFTVYYQVKVANVVRFQGTIAAGSYALPTLPGVIGGPVEVIAWNDGYGGSNPADVFASQRVLSNYGEAFNEQVGTPAEELSSHYLWTWYDNTSAGAFDWVLLANPPGSGYNLFYEIWIDGVYVCSDVNCEGAGGGYWSAGPIPQGSYITPMFNRQGGPVEVKTFADPGHAIPADSIASQRILWGPSFAETPGFPFDDLASNYHWTWYDQDTAGMANWVMIANPSATDTIQYQILIGGVEPASGGSGTIAPGENATPAFPGEINGPVEVRTWIDGGDWNTPSDRRASIASQRVVFKGFFNEVLGTVLD